MGSYGDVALKATALFTAGRAGSPAEAWKVAAREVFTNRSASQKKGCPRGAYLGLCQQGLVAGVPPGDYTRSQRNSRYAIAAVRLLEEDPSLAAEGAASLWLRVVRGEPKAHNHQMDVVLTLWREGLVRARVERESVVPSIPAGAVPRHEPLGRASHDPSLLLVACVSMKRPVPTAGRDLYVSPWFEKARRYVDAHAGPWFILSAKHGLVDPDQRVAPYEETLSQKSAAERRAWAALVITALRPRLAGVNRVVLLAGRAYREHLEDEIAAAGLPVEIPLDGLGIGEQLAWFDAQARGCA